MEDILKSVGKAFLLKRLDLNLEIQEVAEKSGLSSLTVSKLERGQLKNTSIETLDKLAGSLGMKLSIQIQGE